jgi:hypothetical protein
MRVSLLILALTALATEPAVAFEPAPQSEASEPLAKKNKKQKKGKKGAEPEPTPPPDADGDGVVDADDKCPEQAEDIDLFEDEDGCPDDDNDGDGISDAQDECPFEAESADGFDDEDGCPEEPPAIRPMSVEATLFDGTTLKGTLVRIVAVDEDDPESAPEEPTSFDVSFGDSEATAEWNSLTKMTGTAPSYPGDFNCYSEGVTDLSDDRVTYECTLVQQTQVYYEGRPSKSKHYFLDRKMKRLDFVFSELTCTEDAKAQAAAKKAGTEFVGTCPGIEANKTLSAYPYRILRFDKTEDEAATLAKLQADLRATQKKQIQSATFAPATPAE